MKRRADFGEKISLDDPLCKVIWMFEGLGRVPPNLSIFVNFSLGSIKRRVKRN